MYLFLFKALKLMVRVATRLTQVAPYFDQVALHLFGPYRSTLYRLTMHLSLMRWITPLSPRAPSGKLSTERGFERLRFFHRPSAIHNSRRAIVLIFCSPPRAPHRTALRRKRERVTFIRLSAAYRCSRMAAYMLRLSWSVSECYGKPVLLRCIRACSTSTRCLVGLSCRGCTRAAPSGKDPPRRKPDAFHPGFRGLRPKKHGRT